MCGIYFEIEHIEFPWSPHVDHAGPGWDGEIVSPWKRFAKGLWDLPSGPAGQSLPSTLGSHLEAAESAAQPLRRPHLAPGTLTELVPWMILAWLPHLTTA